MCKVAVLDLGGPGGGWGRVCERVSAAAHLHLQREELQQVVFICGVGSEMCSFALFVLVCFVANG